LLRWRWRSLARTATRRLRRARRRAGRRRVRDAPRVGRPLRQRLVVGTTSRSSASSSSQAASRVSRTRRPASAAGRATHGGQLYVPFLRIAQQAQARAVLIENVRGMLTSPSATHGTALHEVVAAVRAAGFEHTTVHNVLNAADYGVPQKQTPTVRCRASAAQTMLVASSGRVRRTRAMAACRSDARVSVREALGLGGGSMVRDVTRAEREPRSLDELSYTIRAGASGRAPGGVRLLDQPAHTVSTGGVDTGGAEPFANATYRKQTERRALRTRPASAVRDGDGAQERQSPSGARARQTNPRRCGDQLNPLLD
jgi:site-specific DNA-cytosine methylase